MNTDLFNVQKLSDLDGKVNTDVLRQIRLQHKEAEVEDENYLTELQKKTFSNSDFWNATKNVIVRGRTSSGKTMIAKIATSYFGNIECIDMDYEQSKIIYLVPLRAMVAEKIEDFKNTFEKTLQWKVFASSSDYQDHDEDIINGKFKIAVIVYEKFFALIAQDNKFIRQCSLIIVDELQMLGVEDRGAKLEVALTKINIVNPKCKIIGLTPFQGDISFVKKWLGATEIECQHRPKSLNEYIVWPERIQNVSESSLQDLSTSYKFNYYLNVDKKDHDICSLNNLNHGDAAVLFEKNIKPDFNGNNCEKSIVADLIECILSQNSSAKILVFINNKTSVEQIAKLISERLSNISYKKKYIDPNDQRIFDLHGSEEESIDTFLDHILPYGVAYHHGGLSRTMRDFVEEEFRKSNGYINIVVATETLAIGVNMPADIVILVGVVLPRGGDKNNVMKSSEYKNCVGRAGRLGINSADSGYSYLIATSRAQANDYWEKYIKAKPVSIISYMLNLSDEQKSPYMLNLVQCNERELGGNGYKFELKDYGKAANKSFINYCTENNRKRIINNEKIELFDEEASIYKRQLDSLISVEMIDKNNDEYEITSLGNVLSRFALSTNTVKIISNIQKQVNKYLSENLELLKSYDAQHSFDSIVEINKTRELVMEYFNKHFIDILFELCNAVEIGRGFDDNVDNTYINNAMIYLDNNHNDLIKDGQLYKMLTKYKESYMELPNLSKSRALRNAILLYEWCQGISIKEIKKKTGLNYARAGDIDRLGDVMAYLWEAMAYSFQRYGNSSSYTGGLAKIAGKIKYGVPEDSVLLANRHIPYLSREQILKIREIALNENMDPVSFARNEKNANKVLIPNKTFLLLSKSLQMYYSTEGEIFDSSFYLKKGLLNFVAKRVIDTYETNGYLKPNDFIGLFSNEKIKYDINVHHNHVEILVKGLEKLFVYPFDKRINDDWIKTAIANNSEKSTNIICLVCEPVENSYGLSQITYNAFFKLYTESLKKIGNLSMLIKILLLGYSITDEKTAEEIFSLYFQGDNIDLIKKEVENLLSSKMASLVVNGNLSIDNSNVTIHKSQINEMGISIFN